MYDNRLVCPICGGIISADESRTVGTCTGCGKKFAYPKSDIKKLNRITYLRNIYEFGEASKLAAALIASAPDDSEAYWAALLCEFEIQYIREGTSRVPVCRKFFTAETPDFKESDNYKKALLNADAETKAFYEELAATLEDSINVARNIMKQEKSYDIFVTSPDGVSAEDDIEGGKLFLRFASNLGMDVYYVPETARDMDPVEKAAQTAFALRNSRILLPVFKNQSDCHDDYIRYVVNGFFADDDKKLAFPIINTSAVSFQQIPEKLVWLDDIFDLSEEEFMREISEKVEGILKPEEAAIVPDSIVTATAANKENLIKRAYMFLEDGEFETADSYFDKILDIDIEDARAYIGKLLAECRIRNEEEIANLPQTVTDDKNFKKALRFASPEQKERYEALNGAIVKRIEDERREIAEQHARLKAEREEKEAIERARRERQNKEERKLLYQRRRDPLRKTLLEVQAELGKAFITPKRKKELQEEEETLKKNLKELEMQFPDIWD